MNILSFINKNSKVPIKDMHKNVFAPTTLLLVWFCPQLV